MQLKQDILKEAVDIVSVVTSSDELIDLEKSSDPPHPTNTSTNMLDILLNGIGVDNTTAPDDQDNSATANILCENQMYQLLHQLTDSRILRGLLSSTLQFLLHLHHLSASGAELQESSLPNEINCRRR